MKNVGSAFIFLCVVALVVSFIGKSDVLSYYPVPISAESTPQTAPDFLGKTGKEVVSLSRKTGIKIDQAFVWSTDQSSEDGKVVNQEPSPGEELPPNSGVHLAYGRWVR